MAQTPIIGRIVHFFHEEDLECAAIVTNDNDDGTLALHVFLVDGTIIVESAEHTERGERGHWNWPPRQ